MNMTKKLVAEVPRRAGRAVSFVQFKGSMFLVCERAVFFLNDDGTFLPVSFVEIEREEG